MNFSLRTRAEISRSKPVARHYFTPVCWLVVVFGSVSGTALPMLGNAFEPGTADFFEQKIRPVLIEHCFECHSQEADEIGGHLYLDSADAMRSGGESGQAVHPGDPSASLLISALKYESSEMPPDQRLPDDVVRDFEKWIEAGAVDPRTNSSSTDQRKGTANVEIDLDQGRQFWAFRPISSNNGTPGHRFDATAIDAFVRNAADDSHVTLGPTASPESRLRRLAFDLTGLPPDLNLQKRWLAEPTQSHWERIVDQMLQSRSFAQHWARHWMDIARYADSNGSDFNATYHDAWRYRDYLIDSFQADRPLDEMIRQHVAGDLMDATTDQERYDNIVATTFLMLGPKMLSERDKPKLTLDVVDEQIDTIGRAFLGMTLGCARCHDHKFDPIPTEDYYALAGIFRSTRTLRGESQKYVSDFNRVELPVQTQRRADLKAYQRDFSLSKKRVAEITQELSRANTANQRGTIIDDVDAGKKGNWTESKFSKDYFGAGYVHDNNADKGNASIEFRTRLKESGEYEVRLAYAASGNRARNVLVTVVDASESHRIIVDQQKAGPEKPWSTLGTFHFDSDADAVVTIRNEGSDGYVIADAVQFLKTDQANSQPDLSDEQSARIANLNEQLAGVKATYEELKANPPKPLPTAMAPADLPADQIADSPVHRRGELKNLGDVVPRGFLQVCSTGDASIASPVGSGRLELAHWLTDPDNPLVARVMVNRIWLKLFGEGIVRTPDNFGDRGERPTHPALLDALAMDLMREGWRAKRLIRKMVLSETYSRSSDWVPHSASVDPENRLLWRANRKRISAESIRDSMLVAAAALTNEEPDSPVSNLGTLATKNNGNSKSVSLGLAQPVRSIYLPIIRGNVDPFLVALDAADPDLLVGRRPTTNVPAQALVLLNSEDINQWASQAATRIVGQYALASDRIKAAYRICYSRMPSQSEIEAAEHYLSLGDSNDDQVELLRDFVAAVFASAEFRLLD